MRVVKRTHIDITMLRSRCEGLTVRCRGSRLGQRRQRVEDRAANTAELPLSLRAARNSRGVGKCALPRPRRALLQLHDSE